MGNNQSHSDKTKPLIIQRNFEATIHRRFIKERVVTIELEDNFWTKPHNDEIEIKDLRSGQVLFRLPPSPDNAPRENEKKLLLDAFRVPILGMEWSNAPPSLAEYVITPGGASATEELFRFTTQFNPFDYPLELVLNKDSPEGMIKVCVIGKWLARRAVFGIQRGERETIYKIGEVNCVETVTSDKYRIDIAPGVDIALIVLFAAAMDEQARRNQCGSDRAALKTEIKREKKIERKMRKAGNINFAEGQGVPATATHGTVNVVGTVGAVHPNATTLQAASAPVAQAS